jgi:hypothetical protein
MDGLVGLSSLVLRTLVNCSYPTDFPYVFNIGYLIRSAYSFYGWPAQIKTGKMV